MLGLEVRFPQLLGMVCFERSPTLAHLQEFRASSTRNAAIPYCFADAALASVRNGGCAEQWMGRYTARRQGPALGEKHLSRHANLATETQKSLPKVEPTSCNLRVQRAQRTLSRISSGKVANVFRNPFTFALSATAREARYEQNVPTLCNKCSGRYCIHRKWGVGGAL